MGILRKLFGPSQKEIWGQLAEKVQGQLIGDGIWDGNKVTVKTDNWIVTLDTYAGGSGQSDRIYTRMRAPYVNADKFRIKIYREGHLSPLGRAFGMQDIATGDPQFDKQFVIKGNDAAKVRRFFSDDHLRALLYAEPHLSFEVKGDEGFFGATFPEGVDELFFRRHGIMKNLAELQTLFDLFSYSLHRLCQMGSAYDKDPGMELWGGN